MTPDQIKVFESEQFKTLEKIALERIRQKYPNDVSIKDWITVNNKICAFEAIFF